MSPRRPKKPCAKVNCKELVEAGKRYCPEHEREYRQRKDKEHDSAKFRRIALGGSHANRTH